MSLITIEESVLREAIRVGFSSALATIGGLGLTERRRAELAAVISSSVVHLAQVTEVQVQPPGDAAQGIGEAAARAHNAAECIVGELNRLHAFSPGDEMGPASRPFREHVLVVAALARVVAELAVAVKDAARYL